MYYVLLLRIEMAQRLAAKTKSFPQTPLSGHGCNYPWVGGWDLVLKLSVDCCGKTVGGGGGGIAQPNPTNSR